MGLFFSVPFQVFFHYSLSAFSCMFLRAASDAVRAIPIWMKWMIAVTHNTFIFVL